MHLFNHYSQHGNIVGEKFDTKAVVEKVKMLIQKKFDKDCLTIKEVPSHTPECLIETMKKEKCLCGIVYIGHSSTNPSRMIFDPAANGQKSIASSQTEGNPHRYPPTCLPVDNLLPCNTSAIFGCQSAKGENSISESISKHFCRTVVGSKGKLNFDGGNPYTPSFLWRGGSEFVKFKNAKEKEKEVPKECCCTKEKKDVE